MAGMAGIYDGIRREVSELVSSLDERGLIKEVPATPGWSVKDVVAHVTGVAEGALAGEFPTEFFEAFGEPDAVRKVNSWTSDQVTARKNDDIETILDEWAKHAAALLPILDGETPVSSAMPPFGDRILTTDASVHQQDLFGAFGMDRGREEAPVKIGSSSYVAMMDIRMRKAGTGSLLLDAGTKQWTVGEDDPKGSVRTTRFEFFRALSGRRSPEQIKDYEWTVDPEPYIDFFYPYGVRTDALAE